MRETYRPLDWGLSRDAEPRAYLEEVRPRHLYIADLDRIGGRGSHDDLIGSLLPRDGVLLLDRGVRSPDDFLPFPGVTPVIGTETAGPDLGAYHGGYLSLDLRGGRVVPSGESPDEFLRLVDGWDFEGVILLSVSAVGTGNGVPGPAVLSRYRGEYAGPLLWGGGVRDQGDLTALEEAGFDGAIICTAIHTGRVPVEWVRRGTACW